MPNPILDTALARLREKKNPAMPVEEIPLDSISPLQPQEQVQPEVIQPTVQQEVAPPAQTSTPVIQPEEQPMNVEQPSATVDTPISQKDASETKEFQASSYSIPEYVKAPPVEVPKELLDEFKKLNTELSGQLQSVQEDAKTDQERQRKLATIAAISDGISALANLVGTVKYAPVAAGQKSLSAVYQQAEKNRAERKALTSQILKRIDELGKQGRGLTEKVWELNSKSELANRSEYNALARKIMDVKARENAEKNKTDYLIELKKLQIEADKAKQKAELAAKRGIAELQAETTRGDIRYNQFRPSDTDTEKKKVEVQTKKYGQKFDFPTYAEDGKSITTVPVGLVQIQQQIPLIKNELTSEVKNKYKSKYAVINGKYQGELDKYNAENGTDYKTIDEVASAESWDPDWVDAWQDLGLDKKAQSLREKEDEEIRAIKGIKYDKSKGTLLGADIVKNYKTGRERIRQFSEEYSGGGAPVVSESSSTNESWINDGKDNKTESWID